MDAQGVPSAGARGSTDRHGTSRMYVEGRLSTRTEGLGPGVSGPFAPHIKVAAR